MYLQLQRTGDESGDLPGRYRLARCGNPNSWLRPAAPREDTVSSPDQKAFHVSATPKTPATKAVIPRNDTAPHEVETAKPAIPLTGVREAIDTWGGYTVPSPDKKAFHISTTKTNRGRKR